MSWKRLDDGSCSRGRGRDRDRDRRRVPDDEWLDRDEERELGSEDGERRPRLVRRDRDLVLDGPARCERRSERCARERGRPRDRDRGRSGYSPSSGELCSFGPDRFVAGFSPILTRGRPGVGEGLAVAPAVGSANDENSDESWANTVRFVGAGWGGCVSGESRLLLIGGGSLGVGDAGSGHPVSSEEEPVGFGPLTSVSREPSRSIAAC